MKENLPSVSFVLMSSFFRTFRVAMLTLSSLQTDTNILANSADPDEMARN